MLLSLEIHFEWVTKERRNEGNEEKNYKNKESKVYIRNTHARTHEILLLKQNIIKITKQNLILSNVDDDDVLNDMPYKNKNMKT